MYNLSTYMNHKTMIEVKNKMHMSNSLSYAKDLTLFHICLPDFNK